MYVIIFAERVNFSDYTRNPEDLLIYLKSRDLSMSAAFGAISHLQRVCYADVDLHGAAISKGIDSETCVKHYGC